MQLSLLIVINVILFLIVNGQKRILTVEEVEAIRCYQNVSPYNGPPQLLDILTDQYTYTNGKYMYYISPLGKVVSQGDMNNQGGTCLGVFQSLNVDPSDPKKVILNYAGGEQCVGHQLQRATIEIVCDRDLTSPFEISDIQQTSPCDTVIMGRSPVLCTVPLDFAEQRNHKKKEEILKVLKSIEYQLKDIQNQVWEMIDDLNR